MTVQTDLIEILETFQNGHRNRTALYTDVALRLSEIVDKSPPWKPDYIQAVSSGTLAASTRLVRAIDVLTAEMDGMPAVVVNTEPVTIYARPGSIQPGALLIGESRLCAYGPCSTYFIKTHPRMRYCPVHRDPKTRR